MRKKCPTCEVEVANLPRHMKLTHKWSIEHARNVNQVTNQRKKYTWQHHAPVRRKSKQKKKSSKDYRQRKRCPVQGCSAVVVKLYVHLLGVHKMKPGSDYYELLSKARNFSRGFSDTLPIDTAFTIEHEVIPVAQNELDDANSETRSSSNDQVTNEGEGSNYGNNDVTIAPNNFTRVTLARFLDYLLSPDGGQRENKSLLQTVNEVKCAINVLDGKVGNVFDKRKMRDKFFRDFLDKKAKPGTAKHYLTSLVSFVDFAIADELNVPGYQPEDFLKTRLRFSNWRKTYTKLVDERW